jgi:tRNA(Ile)-lysidine synthase
VKQTSKLVLIARKPAEEPAQYVVEIPSEWIFPIKLSVKMTTVFSPSDKNRMVIDSALLTEPLVLRHSLPNDYIYPAGMAGRKSLGKFFKDHKLPVYKRPDVWVLAQGHEIVWIIGIRANRRFLAAETSRQLLAISCIE